MSSVDATVAIVDALESCCIEYMLVGAFSSNAYGIARATHDADFVVALQKGQLRALIDRLGSEFSLDPQMQMEGFTGSIRNVITHRPTEFRIELFRLNSSDEHHNERFRRRQRRPLAELQRDVWIPTVEDVVIQKLRWQRRKDLDDVVGVLTVSGSIIDWNYVRTWTVAHGTDTLLQELLREVPDLPESEPKT